MTLPLFCELHWLPHATSSGIRCTFKQGIHVHADYLIFSHHMPFTQMLSNQYIFPTKCFRHIINTATIRVFTTTTMETAELLADGLRIFHLECHYCFNPVHTTPHNTVTMTPHSSPQTPTRPVHCCLSFSSDIDHSSDSIPECSDSSDEEEEDFQTVPLDDDHSTSEEVPERTFCIHEHGLPHNLCQYPCPYVSNDTVSYMDSLDLSDISDYEDYMVTSNDEELLGMEEVPY